MRPETPLQSKAGFSLLELLVVIGIIAILAAMLLPALSRAGSKGKQTACLSHLRQIGLGFQMFANDHDSLFPMQVAAQEGGSMESNTQKLAGSSVFSFSAQHFRVLSNELKTPAVLVCPADRIRPAANFAELDDSKISYWVYTNARWGRVDLPVSGDRNLLEAKKQPTNASVNFTWTREIHQYRGNLLFGDGHVELTRSFESGFANAGDPRPPTPSASASPAPSPVNSGGAGSTGSSAVQLSPGGSAKAPTPPGASPPAATVQGGALLGGAGKSAAAAATMNSSPPPQNEIQVILPMPRPGPRLAPDEPWNTPAFRTTQAVVEGGYFFILLWAILIILLEILRNRSRKRKVPAGGPEPERFS